MLSRMEVVLLDVLLHFLPIHSHINAILSVVETILQILQHGHVFLFVLMVILEILLEVINVSKFVQRILNLEILSIGSVL